MKLVRYGAPGREKPGIIGDDGKDPRPVAHREGHRRRDARLGRPRQNQKANLKRMKPVSGKPRLGPCIGNVRNFIAIGLNYSDHAAEAGMPIPKEPIIFNKAPSCICGPNDDTIIPTRVEQARLGGRARHRHRQARALSRAATRRRTPSPAISSATMCPSAYSRSNAAVASGTRARAARPSARSGRGSSPRTRSRIRRTSNMWLDVNGEKRQRGNTKTMIFDCEHLVWYCSQFFVMEPGDIIITGTPPGVGARDEADAGVSQGRRRR